MRRRPAHPSPLTGVAQPHVGLRYRPRLCVRTRPAAAHDARPSRNHTLYQGGSGPLLARPRPSWTATPSGSSVPWRALQRHHDPVRRSLCLLCQSRQRVQHISPFDVHREAFHAALPAWRPGETLQRRCEKPSDSSSSASSPCGGGPRNRSGAPSGTLARGCRFAKPGPGGRDRVVATARDHSFGPLPFPPAGGYICARIFAFWSLNSCSVRTP